ncbi:MAG: peptidase T [Erysipelotrichales bacterium]|nr:peptidase T [Erysipelotrichales bacterium]
MNIRDRFIEYVKIDTQSDESSNTYPSTAKQLDLAKKLVEELQQLGISNAYLDKYGIVYAKIPKNTDEIVDKIGLIAHMDTSPDCSGKDVEPRIIEKYNGEDIVLNKDENIILDTKTFPSLLKNVGETLVVTNGKTLLGADDKAGIAIIMTFIEKLLASDIKHGQISIAFTPDEEIGRGTDNFNIEEFDADYAYTLDGGDIHYIEYENFNAASAIVKIHGVSIHPGSAKDKMINSILVAEEFNDLLPSDMIPSKTEGYQGFNHLCDIKGNCEYTEMEYIIRNHTKSIFEKQKKDFEIAKNILNHKYGYEIVEVIIEDSYENMRTYIEKDPRSLDRIVNVYKRLNIDHEFEPIRGGTDGARLTVMGLPTPNLGTGGYNYHGRFEYASLTQMSKMVDILLELVK